MVGWLVGQLIVGAISFQKIFGLCGLKGHIMEERVGCQAYTDGRMECEDRARILESELVVCKMSLFHYKILFTKTPSMDGCSTVMLKEDGWDWIDHLVG